MWVLLCIRSVYWKTNKQSSILFLAQEGVMNKVLSLQQANSHQVGVAPDSIFSFMTIAGCTWTHRMPYSTASAVFC